MHPTITTLRVGFVHLALVILGGAGGGEEVMRLMLTTFRDWVYGSMGNHIEGLVSCI